jgi:hypothetical protein
MASTLLIQTSKKAKVREKVKAITASSATPTSSRILLGELVNHADPAVPTRSGAPCRPRYMDSIWSHSHLATPTSAACSSLDDD